MCILAIDVHSYDGLYHVTAWVSAAFQFYTSNKPESVWHCFGLAGAVSGLRGIYILSDMLCDVSFLFPKKLDGKKCPHVTTYTFNISVFTNKKKNC